MKSNCCNSSLQEIGRFLGSGKPRYFCTKCNKPCSVKINSSTTDVISKGDENKLDKLIEKNIGQLRQWINEKPKNFMVTDEGLKTFLEIDEFIELIRKEETERAKRFIKAKKLPVPNPYGTTVKVEKYNKIMDQLLQEIGE